MVATAGTSERSSAPCYFTPDAAASIRIDEVAALLGGRSDAQTVRADQELIRAGQHSPPLFIPTQGIAISYRILPNGQREIFDIILPGDFAGPPSSYFFGKALYSVRTLTRVKLLQIPVPGLVALCNTSSKAAERILREFASNAAVYAERLITIGRRPATERIAHFLLELFTRLQRIGLTDGDSFQLPLTQEMLGDVLGLSNTYVSRVLHQLREDGLVHIRNRVVVIDDMDELAYLADFKSDYLMPLPLTAITATARTMGAIPSRH